MWACQECGQCLTLIYPTNPTLPYKPYPTLQTLPHPTYPTPPYYTYPTLPYIPYPTLHTLPYPTYPTLPYKSYPTLQTLPYTCKSVDYLHHINKRGAHKSPQCVCTHFCLNRSTVTSTCVSIAPLTADYQSNPLLGEVSKSWRFREEVSLSRAKCVNLYSDYF